MTFTEAALEILKREGKPLHFKELTERAMTKKLLTFVGRTPEVTMQTQLTAAVKKAPGNPFVRVRPGVFGLLRYPELPPEDEAPAASEKATSASEKKNGQAADDAKTEGRGDKRRDRTDRRASDAGDEERGRRRRRRGGRGRGGNGGSKEGAGERSPAARASAEDSEASPGPREGRETIDSAADEGDEPSTGGLSPEARAAALAETGVLEGDDDMTSADDDAEDAVAGEDGGEANGENGGELATASDRARDAGGDQGPDEGPGSDDDGDDDFGGEDAFAAGEPGSEAKAGEGEELGRRRRRRRRRRRGGGVDGDLASAPGSGAGEEGQPGLDASSEAGTSSALAGAPGAESGGEATPAPTAEGGAAGEAGAAGQPARRIMAPVDAAIEILRGQPPGRGVHVRQIADSATRRRLIHGEPNEAWRAIRTALAAEPKDRLRNGMRPRVRAAGSGLYALSRRPPDGELEKAEQVFGEARRALRERTLAALERRIAELPAGAFEALARVLLQREGFGPTTFVKRVDGTIYVEALRGRGSRPSKCLIGLRPGASSAGRRAIGELRAGIRARGQDEGLLMLAGRLADDAISEWKLAGVPLEIADGAAMAETCARHGVGVLPAVLHVDFVDADFFAELAEG